MDRMKAKDIIKEEWDRLAQDFDNRAGHGIRTKEEEEAWRNLLTSTIGTNRLKILDVGCGTGVIALLLAKMGHDVTGVDISERMLERAREKSKGIEIPVKFDLGDAEDLPFHDEIFDVVVNRHLLWTMLNPEKAVSEWKRVLKPEGKMIIIDSSWNGQALRKRVWRFLAVPLILITEHRISWHGHYDKDTEKNLPMKQRKRPQADIEILERCGFVDINVSKMAIPITRTFIERLKYGYWGNDKFLLSATKLR